MYMNGFVKNKRTDLKGAMCMKNLLIIGAGSSGELLSKEIMKNNHKYDYNIIGFLDNSEEKHNKIINGYKVLGSHENAEYYIQEYNVSDIIIAITSIAHKDLEKIYNRIKGLKVNVKILPSFEELLLREPFAKQLRDVAVEDLLGRDTIQINSENIISYIKNKTIVVTGAAGSIGSELCRQIIKYNPKEMILIDVNENDLYLLELYLNRHYNIKINSEICNIREKEKLDFLFMLYKPNIVFHAAAHKHVPLMEKNIEEAIKNNIFGTKNLIDLSEEYSVEKFVLISTDKAVNPTNIMGATKRAAELLIEEKNRESKTEYIAVRFGNVLGSNGSVIPIFKNLIKEGKNLTVTHTDVTRYFMTIPEAAQLVLEAGFIGKGGEVFVLDMGKPVRIVELAEKMIELSGLKKGRDINIDITGLRPGEKLYEELLYDINCCEKTENKKIFIAKIKEDGIELDKNLQELMELVNKFDREKMREKLKKIVPTYKEVKY